MPIKRLTPNRHIKLIKRILHHKVRIQFIHLPYNNIDIRGHRIRKQEELRPRQRLETGESELLRFEVFESRCWNPRVWERVVAGCRGRGRGGLWGTGDGDSGGYRSGYSVDSGVR